MKRGAIAGFKRQLDASRDRLAAEGKLSPPIMTHPGRCKARTPGRILHRVGIRDGDRHRDWVEAMETFQHKPWAQRAHYLGSARGWHLFEYDPEPSP